MGWGIELGELNLLLGVSSLMIARGKRTKGEVWRRDVIAVDRTTERTNERPNESSPIIFVAGNNGRHATRTTDQPTRGEVEEVAQQR